MDVRCACLVVVVALVCLAVGVHVRGEGAHTRRRISALRGTGESDFSVHQEEHSTVEEISSQVSKTSALREN